MCSRPSGCSAPWPSPPGWVILLSLQQGERRITDLAAELGGSQTSISAHVTSLKDSGLIVGRPEGRAVYYRLAQPELDSLFQAAEQVLAATGHPVQPLHLRDHLATMP